MSSRKWNIVFFALICLGNSVAFANWRLHLVDSSKNGFALYRLGRPENADQISKLCSLGITEIWDLANNAKEAEYKWHDRCPGLNVLEISGDDDDAPIKASYLKKFDVWIQDARQNGKKVAIRCEHGCHRTGRLAAYYQMKYQHLTAEDVTAIMYAHGCFMPFKPQLQYHVRALSEYLQGKPCTPFVRRTTEIMTEVSSGLSLLTPKGARPISQPVPTLSYSNCVDIDE